MIEVQHGRAEPQYTSSLATFCLPACACHREHHHPASQYHHTYLPIQDMPCMLRCIQLPAALNTLQADRKYIATRLIKVSARHSANTSASTKAQTQAELSASPARMKALQLPSGTDLDALADEAIVWASQHGLVGLEAPLNWCLQAYLTAEFSR